MQNNPIQTQKKIEPFLKWVGGKRWLVKNNNFIIPSGYSRYIEPFLGGGAFFFHLQPKIAILGDINLDLVETYKALKTDWESVFVILKDHAAAHSEAFFYKMRTFEPKTQNEKAARFIYLNRTCWRGLYRCNKSGIFNVPLGKSDQKIIFESDYYQSISNLLKNVDLEHSDFENLIDKAESDDLLFIDPPYVSEEASKGFIAYNAIVFSWDDQLRLFRALLKAKQRNVKIISTNIYHDSLMNLYKNDFKINLLQRSNSLGDRRSSSRSYKEFLISNL